MTQLESTSTSEFPPVEGVFADVLAGNDAALTRIDEDEALAAAVLAFVADPAQASLLAARPRPNIALGAHPIRLCLHAMARQVQYDGSTLDLAADFLEALDALLLRGNVVWTDHTAALWATWVMHQSEAASGWHFARLILQRHVDVDAPPQMLASFAVMAERSGELEAARELWDRALSHPLLVTSARTRWLVEFKWAQSHLMLSAGQPMRAVFVLERVYAGLTSIGGADNQLLLIDVALGLSFYLVLVGRPVDALDVLGRTRVLLAASPEFDAWLRGVEALAFSVAGRTDEAERALRDSERAGADTSSLELSATFPAAMFIAARRRDTAALDTIVQRSRVRMQERQPDSEQRLIWTYCATVAALAAGMRDRAAELASELEELIEDARMALPAHCALASIVTSTASGDVVAMEAARERARRHGLELPDTSVDVWGMLDLQATSAGDTEDVIAVGDAVRLEVLDGLRVLVNGEPVDPSRWAQRRKARVALAVLIASGGRIERDALTDGLWHGTDMAPSQAASRISTVLSVARSVIAGDAVDSGAGPRPQGSRAIVARASTVELLLGDGDTTDIGDVRALAREASAADARDGARFASIARALVPLLSGTPLGGLGTDPIVGTWRQRIADELVEVGLVVARAWLAATQVREGATAEPPAELIALAAALVRIDPLDEQAASCQLDVLVRAGRTAEASHAFHRFRQELKRAVGLNPSVDLVRRHAALMAAETSTDR